MSRVEQLVENTFVYAIGNFSARFFSILMVPILTRLLAPEEYGYYDLIVTTTVLVIPFASFLIADSQYRFLVDAQDEDTRRRVTSSALSVLGAAFVLFTALFWIYTDLRPTRYAGYVYIFTAASMVNQFWLRAARGLKKPVVYAQAGVLSTVLVLALAISLVTLFQMGADGLLVASTASYLASTVFTESRIHLMSKFGIRFLHLHVVSDMLRYSMPLLPNSVSWWLMSGASRYIINHFGGAYYNGIYAIALRFPAVISISTGIFYIAWQDSAISEYQASDRDAYYSKVFRVYMNGVLTFALILIPATKLGFNLLLGHAYSQSADYIPLLYISAAFSAFALFYGTGYLSSRKTVGAFTTTMVSGLANATLSFILFPHLGLYSVVLASLVANVLLWGLRVSEMKSFFHISIDWRRLLQFMLLIAGFTLCYRLADDLLNSALLVVGLAVGILHNRSTALRIAQYAGERLMLALRSRRVA